VAPPRPCPKGGTLVSIGLDENGNGVLDDPERHSRPMVFCTTAKFEMTVTEVPPNDYCARPGAVVTIHHAEQSEGSHAEIVVCFSPSGREIESAYQVYDAH
jgi:putative hemolysin